MKKILLTIAVCLPLLTSEALAKSTNATIGETVFAQQSNKWEYLKEVSIYWSTGELKGRIPIIITKRQPNGMENTNMLQMDITLIFKYIE